MAADRMQGERSDRFLTVSEVPFFDTLGAFCTKRLGSERKWWKDGLTVFLLQYCMGTIKRGAPCKAPRGPIWVPCKAPTGKENGREIV